MLHIYITSGIFQQFISRRDLKPVAFLVYDKNILIEHVTQQNHFVI